MRRLSAPLALIFMVSLLLASYGHCGPMLSAQIAQLMGSGAHHAHHHDQSPVDHAQHAQLADPAVQSLPPAIAPAPLAKESVPILLAIAVVPAEYVVADATRPAQQARAGPSPFTVFHARTGRLLI